MESESPPDGARRKGERGEGGQASWSLGGRQQQQQQQQQQRAGAEAGAPSPPRPPASGMLYSTLFFLVVVIFGTMMEATNSFVLGSRGNGRGGNNPSSLQLPRTSELQRRMTFLSPSLIAHRQSTVRSSRSSTALAAFKRLPLGAGVSVSLDKPSLPKGIRPGAGQAPHFVWVLAGVTLALLLLGKLPGVGLVNGAVRDFCERNNLDIYDKLAYRLRLLKGRLERITDGLKRRWLTAFPREVDILPSTSYPVALTLVERSNIGGSFLKYKFALPRPTHVMELDLGQQITLIGSTPEERVMRAAFVPCSERGEPGVMEVVSEKNNPDDPSVRILDTLAIGETIQATPGVRLTNRHPGPINKLLIVVSKLGVVPALQFLKALLPTTSGYSVDFANVVWVNERQDQYILQEELQALFYKYNSKLDVFTVAERDLFMGDLAANSQFRMSIPPPSTDTLVLVAGPEYFTTKAIDYLTKSGYVEDVIVTL